MLLLQHKLFNKYIRIKIRYSQIYLEIKLKCTSISNDESVALSTSGGDKNDTFMMVTALTVQTMSCILLSIYTQLKKTKCISNKSISYLIYSTLIPLYTNTYAYTYTYTSINF